MASNVSNLLKEKIVTPVANSVAAQVDNKVKNGIILRKFIGVQLGESNTGCQLVKIDLNKINVKDPSYEFTLYIKAFSQKGLFNFIINVNKTDSLQVDVKCEVKNSDSINGEVIGYYDVDAVGNTITISLVKDFVVNTSINECKFVSTKDTLNISDLDIDWSDTGNIKTTSSINIRYDQTSIYEYDEYFYSYKPDFADGEMYQIAKFDFSEILNKTLTGNKNFNIIIDIIYHEVGEFHISFDLMWMRNLSTINMIRGAYEKIPFQSSMEGRNFDELFKFCKKDNTTLLLLINPPAMYISGGKFVIRRIEVHRADADIESDLVKIDLTPEKLVNSDGSLVIGSITRHKASIPAPTDSEISNGYFLKADGTWGSASHDVGVTYVLNKSDLSDNEAYSIGKFDFSKLINEEFESNPIILLKTNLSTSLHGDFTINMRVTWNATGKKIGIVLGSIHIQYDSYTLTNEAERNSIIKISKLNDTTIALCYDPEYLKTMIGSKDNIVIRSFESYILGTDLENMVSPTWELMKIDTSVNTLSNITTYDIDHFKVFQASPIDDNRYNGLVPHPTTSEAENKYLLGADAKWHPRKAGNEYIANLKPTAEILELTETDITKGVSFVTIDFNALSQKIVEATPSTYQEFDISMEILVRELGIISINASFSVTTAGVIACTGVFSNRGLKSVNFSITFDSKIGSTPSPGFFVNDYDTKIFKLALYTVFANNGVKIIDAQITSFSDLISENDITFTWELGVLDKLPAQIGRSNEIYLGVDLPRNQIFRQMNIETPITETEETVVEAERLKYNGLVPAPGKYEVNNGYFLKADGTWDKPGMVGTEDDIKRAYILRPDGSWGERGYDVSVSDIILDPSFMMDGNYLRVMSIDISDLWEDTGSMKTDLINVDFRYEIRTTNGLSEGELTAGLKFKSTGELEYHNINLYFENIYPYDMYATLGCGGINVDRTNKKIDLYINPWNITSGDQESYRIKSAYCSIGGNTKPSIDLTPTLIESSTLTEFIDAVLNDRILGFKTFETWDITGTYEDSPSSEIPDDLNTLYNLQRFRYNGLVPSPSPKDVENGCFLKADGTWKKMESGSNFTAVPITLDPTKYQEAYETQANPDASKKTIMFMNLNLSSIVTTGTSITKIELSMYSPIYGASRLVIDTMINSISNQYCVNEDANGAGFYMDYYLAAAQVENSGFTGKGNTKIESFYTFVIDGNTLKIGISPIIFKLFSGTTPPYPIVTLEDCKVFIQSITDGTTSTDISGISISYEQSTYTLNSIYGANHNGWIAKNTIFSSYNDSDIRDFQSLHNGLVPAPTREESEQNKFLKADGTWSDLGVTYKGSITLTGTNYGEYIRIAQIVSDDKVNAKASFKFRITLGGVNDMHVFVQFDRNGAVDSLKSSITLSNFDLYNLHGAEESLEENNEYMAYIYYDSNVKKYDICINSILISSLNGYSLNKLDYSIIDYVINGKDTNIEIDWNAVIIDSKPSGAYEKTITSLAPDQYFTPHPDSYDDLLSYTYRGLVPSPSETEVKEGKFLKADGTWAIPPSTRGNDNYITKVERDPSTVDQVSATKATSFLTIDYSTICEQLGAATGDAGQADANIFTSLEVMVPVWGKIQISIVSFLSDNWFSVLVYSDAGTGWYTDNIAYKIHSDISDNELHTRPGFYTMDDVNKTITLGMYGSYGADEIAIIDCTSIAVGEGFSVDDMIYNYDRQLIDIPESAKDFDEIGITRNTVFQSMAYADTDPDGTKYLYQRGNYNGLVPAPAKYDVTHNYMLRPNGTWGPIEGIIRNRTFTVTPYTDSSSTQTNDYVITEGAEDLAIAINENYSVDINIVFSGLGSKNNTNTTLHITGVTGTVNLYDYSGNPIKYITDGMSMKCTIFKNTIDDPVESMNAYCIYDIISYPDTMNGPSE